MHYKIYHLTKFEYSEPVTESIMEVRMAPRSDERQKCLQFSLAIKPQSHFSGYQDTAGNVIHYFDIPKKHSHLEIRAESIVEVFGPATLPETLDAKVWDEIDELMFHEDFWEYTQPSHFAQPTEALLALMQELAIARDSDPLSVLLNLNSKLFAAFEYSQDTTHVDSPIDDAIGHRSGVCQDFANIMIAIARELRIPCRYASGYLFHRDDDRSHIAADATHAWAEAYLPSLGWVGFDPTNNLVCAERHIRVAVGRDYADVPPTRGIFKGMADSALSVAVRVTSAGEQEIENRKDFFTAPVIFQNAVRRPADLVSQLEQQQQ